MNVTGYLREKILYINLSGEMDEYSAQSARVKCDKLIEENASVRKIIINLSEVAFMDSTGIGVLIGRYKRLTARRSYLYRVAATRSRQGFGVVGYLQHYD